MPRPLQFLRGKKKFSIRNNIEIIKYYAERINIINNDNIRSDRIWK